MITTPVETSDQPGFVSIRTFFIAPIYGIGIVWFVFLAYSFGPDIEQYFFPVITNQSVFDLSRSQDMACWKWHYTKARGATLIDKHFYVEREDGIRYPAAEYRPDLGMPSNNSTTASAGQTRTIPECVSIPAPMRYASRFTIQGSNTYRTLFWNVEQPVPEILVDFPATAAPRPPDSLN